MRIDVAIIEVKDLTKKYQNFTAVDKVSFSIQSGSIFGFLGHNGAGKTTTIKVITGQLGFSSGEVRLFDLDITHNVKQIHQRIGIVSEEQNLYKNLTVFQNIDFYRKLYGLPVERTNDIIQKLDLGEKKNIKTFQLSKGLKQRVLLARSIIHSPKVLFLDEPTSGLDPYSAKAILTLIKRMKESGTTIFLTTHYMEEAEELCDQIAFIQKGKIVKIGSPMDLMREYSSEAVEVIYQVEQKAIHKVFNLSDSEIFREIDKIRELYRIVSIHSREKSLKDIFIQLTEDGKKNES
jgi:ABC-2 type transport system ATP-binding protein